MHGLGRDLEPMGELILLDVKLISLLGRNRIALLPQKKEDISTG